jgi:hypothetical protein
MVFSIRKVFLSNPPLRTDALFMLCSFLKTLKTLGCESIFSWEQIPTFARDSYSPENKRAFAISLRSLYPDVISKIQLTSPEGL